MDIYGIIVDIFRDSGTARELWNEMGVARDDELKNTLVLKLDFSSCIFEERAREDVQKYLPVGFFVRAVQHRQQTTADLGQESNSQPDERWVQRPQR